MEEHNNSIDTTAVTDNSEPYMNANELVEWLKTILIRLGRVEETIKRATQLQGQAMT